MCGTSCFKNIKITDNFNFTALFRVLCLYSYIGETEIRRKMFRMCLNFQIHLVSCETEHEDVPGCHIVHHFSQNLVFT